MTYILETHDYRKLEPLELATHRWLVERYAGNPIFDTKMKPFWENVVQANKFPLMSIPQALDEFNAQKVIIGRILTRHGLVERMALQFENDSDAVAFMMRWS